MELPRGSVGVLCNGANAASPPASQPAQPGSAEIFVSAPITAFPIARPPTETGSATSQALHRWKA